MYSNKRGFQTNMTVIYRDTFPKTNLYDLDLSIMFLPELVIAEDMALLSWRAEPWIVERMCQ